MKGRLMSILQRSEVSTGYFQNVNKRRTYLLLATAFYGLFLGFEVALNYSNSLIFFRAFSLICFALVSLSLSKNFGKNNYQALILVMTLIHNTFHIYACCQTGQNGYLLGMVTAVIIVPNALEMTTLRSIVMMIATFVIFNLMELTIASPILTELITTNLFISVACAYALVSKSVFLKLLYTNYKSQQQLERQRAELIEKNIQLLELGEVKSKLLAVLSHDIRGPLVNIKALHSLKGMKDFSHAELSDLESRIIKSTDVTINLLEDILHWSKSQINGDPVKVNIFNLYALVTKVFDLYSTFADQKNLSLINNVPKDLEICSDPAIVEMILRNLVSNSIKFTPNGHISVGGYSDHNGCSNISVSDTGVGFLTSKFCQNSKWTFGTNGEKGTGLGLAICKDYLGRIKGHLQIINNKDGVEGTTIIIALPLLTSE